MPSKKALFLDRDGIINEDVHYPHKPEHIRFCDGIFSLCKKAQDLGYLLIVITNQAGIAKGYFPEQDVIDLHSWMASEFKAMGINISAFYYCPHHSKGKIDKYKVDCDCRKPMPGMIKKAVEDHDVDISNSLMIGDKESDRIKYPGLKTLILKSQYVQSGFDVESYSEIEANL